MLETIKKGLLASIGAVVLTREHIRQSLNKLVQEGKLSAGEAERLANEMIEDGEKELKAAQERILSLIQRGLKNLDLVSRKEFDELKKRLEALERGKKASTARSGKTTRS